MRWGAREIARAYPSKWGREDVFMSNGGCRMRVSDENESNDVERASRVMSRVLDCSSLNFLNSKITDDRGGLGTPKNSVWTVIARGGSRRNKNGAGGGIRRALTRN